MLVGLCLVLLAADPPAEANTTAAAASTPPTTETATQVCIEKKEMDLLVQLRARRVELDQREAQIKARELAFDKLRKQLDDKLGAMHAELARVETRLQIGEAYRQEREHRLNNLVEAMDSLSAKKAAPVLAVADPTLVAEVMMRLGPQKTAALLAIMRPPQAAKLLEQLAPKPNVKPTPPAATAARTPGGKS